jgi:glutamyl-tRNA reductase
LAQKWWFSRPAIARRSAEIYSVVESDAAREVIALFFSDYHGIDHSRVEGHLYRHEDADAARHLFRVAAGLDSLVVGEPQILGQVKTAYAAAREHRTTGPLINRLFDSAFAVGKRVGTETGLGEGAVSVSYAAIALAKKIFGDLRDRSVLILGTGEMAKLTGIHLQAQQVRQLAIAGRTQQAVEALAAQVGGRAVPWSTLDSALGSADIVVTATGAAAPVLDRGRIEHVMRHRRTRPLFVIDIALPRDVDPAAGELDQVFLYNIDDLRTIVTENLARRSTELERAEAIVAEEVNRFTSWLGSREIIPTLVALRQRFEAIRRAELTRLEPKLSALSLEARTRLDEITRLIVEKLLLTPTEQLKSVSNGTMGVRYADALNRLFRLAVDDKVDSLPEGSETAVSTR